MRTQVSVHYVISFSHSCLCGNDFQQREHYILANIAHQLLYTHVYILQQTPPSFSFGRDLKLQVNGYSSGIYTHILSQHTSEVRFRILM